jgi:hypothetical protein
MIYNSLKGQPVSAIIARLGKNDSESQISGNALIGWREVPFRSDATGRLHKTMVFIEIDAVTGVAVEVNIYPSEPID